MNALILALTMFQPIPEPAYFAIEVEANTQVVVFFKGQRLKPGTTYCTEPLAEKICIELTVRYIDGGEIKTKSFWLDLEPGYKVIWTLTLCVNPPLILEC